MALAFLLTILTCPIATARAQAVTGSNPRVVLLDASVGLIAYEGPVSTPGGIDPNISTPARGAGAELFAAFRLFGETQVGPAAGIASNDVDGTTVHDGWFGIDFGSRVRIAPRLWLDGRIGFHYHLANLVGEGPAGAARGGLSFELGLGWLVRLGIGFELIEGFWYSGVTGWWFPSVGMQVAL
jgi:hypothetical protein